MEICVKCNRSGDEVRLFDGVSINESIKICERCSLLEGIPIIKSPSANQLKSSEKQDHVYKRLKKISGIEEEKQSVSLFDELKKIEENSEIEKLEEKPLRLVDNFYWIIQRERRKRGFTHRQLAATIGESEMVLKLIERNSLPENVMPVIRKLEQFFRIKLVKEPVVQPKIEERLASNNVEVEMISKKEEEEVFESPENISYRELAESTMIDRPRNFKFRKTVENLKIEPKKEESVAKFEEIKKQEPKKVLCFKGDGLKEVTISDLREIHRVIEQDFTKKTSKELGEEQLGSFGKPDEKKDFQIKSWSQSYLDKKKNVISKPEVVPTLAELAERKKMNFVSREDQKSVIGNEIELVEDVDVKLVGEEAGKDVKTKSILGDDIEIIE